MTESGTKYFDSELVENAVLVDVNNGSNDCTNSELEVMNVTTVGNCGKNDIKVSAEGVAKLTFGFLDDMLGGDSSLEPGEVKTPPPGSSPIKIKELTPSRLASEKPEAPAKQLAKETLSKALKTVSQLEAEACEEKVRAILELDAKRRKEEVERRKLEAEKRRQSGETDLELENKRKAKEERRKLKKLKKAKKAAEQALISLEEDNKESPKRKQRKLRGPIESEESEGLCSSGPDDDDEDKTIKSEKHCSALNSAIAVPSVATLRYPAHLPPHLLPDAFMGGFRPINPFLRSPRPDFTHGRGGFLLRGRGGMRGRMPFPLFRPPFFPGAVASGGQIKFNVPHVPHGIQQQRQHHTPPPNRGHSPILPPSSDLLWTKCKPSLSYSLKFNKENKFQADKQHSQITLQSDEKWDGDDPDVVARQTAEDQQDHKMAKKLKSLQKEKKKSKKHRSKDAKKPKRSKISVQASSSSSNKTKKKSRKSSRRKIEKIRKSYGSSARTTPTFQQQHSLDCTEAAENPKDFVDRTGNQNDEEMPNEEEIRQKVENMKQEKVETKQLKIQDLALKVKPFIIIKTEPQEKCAEETKTDKKVKNQQGSQLGEITTFDIFAQSPNRSKDTAEHEVMKQAKASTENGDETEEEQLVSVTPPLPPINNPQVQKTASLQNALEIQKRIDKLLQQDDIKLEAIEAAKNLLIKKTQKHQNAKEKLSPERDSGRTVEEKSTSGKKAESLPSKEKPKAYKDKDLNKKPKEADKEKNKEKEKNSSKHKEDKDNKHHDKIPSMLTKEKPKDCHKDDKKDKHLDIDKEKTRKSENGNEKEKDKEKSRKSITNPSYRNPFKRSLSRDRFFGKIDSRRRSRTRSRERDFSSKRRLSHDRKRGDSSGYSSSRISSKRRVSGCSTASSLLNRSKSSERDIKGSLDSLNSKDKERKNRRREKTPESKSKRNHSATPKRNKERSKELSTKSKKTEKDDEHDYKSTTPPHKLIKSDANIQEKLLSKESKKLKSPVKTAPKKRPLSFTQTEFLFPEDGNEDDFILGDDEETNDSFKNLKSRSDKEDSPDTDDYMDNWENDEDVDIDMNSIMPLDVATPRKSSPDLNEEDSFVTRFANPSPPKEALEMQAETNTKVGGPDLDNDASLPLTPPLDLLKKLPKSSESKVIAQNIVTPKVNPDTKTTPELFGMQELYDQFIKSVEASGVSMKAGNKEQELEAIKSAKEAAETSNHVVEDTQRHNEDPLSTSSASTSSSTSSSSSSSSDSNSSSNSSSSSSSESSSEDSNDGEKFTKTTKQSTKKVKSDEILSPKNSVTADKKQDDSRNDAEKSSNEIFKREPRTPSPSPTKTSLLTDQTPPTPTSQNKTTPKSDVAKDFKKLKNLEANLSRIQMMRANYDSNDEISEELHKMEILFLQEKKIILQKYAKSAQAAEKPTITTAPATEFVPALPVTEFGAQQPPPPPPEEPNKIFDANREAIKLTISPLKLPTKPAIFNISLNEETEKKVSDDKDELDFTEKLVKPAKEVAIVKPMMESKESKESRTRDSHRHRRSPVYGGSRERQRSPNNYRERNRRSSSRSRFSPQRRGRGRSLSLSPPRRGISMRHGSPLRRAAPGSRFRGSSRRSRSRSRSPLRHFGSRRGKESSPFRRKRGTQQDIPSHYKKFGRQRGSRSRSPKSPQARPRSPRTPPPRRRSYSQDPFSRSPLPFKPPSPPMRRSMSPGGSPGSAASRSRSPPSPHRPRSPRSPRLPRSPISPRSLSPRSPRSPDSPPSHRYDDHRYRRENSFERHSSISPHPQYFTPDSLPTNASSQSSPYYYNVSPNRISLDARINIVLNTPASGGDTPPVGYEGYGSYAQYGGAAYMSIPPQPIAGTANNMGYYPNPYVPMLSSTHDGHHSIISPHAHGMQHSLHSPLPHVQQQHAPPYSNIPAISSGTPNSLSPLPPNHFYYNDLNVGHHPINPVIKEIPKAPVAVQKGNVLEIVPSNAESSQSPQIDNKAKTSPVLIETIKNHIDKIASISWKDEVNNRHVKSAVMRLNRGSENAMRSILKRSEETEQPDKIEKKKVYFEDGIYPSRDSEDEDRKLVEYKIRKKVLRLRKKRGIDVPAARDIVESKERLQKPKIDAALEKLPPPPPPATMPPQHLEQPHYLRPPTPVPLVYFHFDPVVHSMYVSQLEKPIPPRLLNPKCVPPGATAASSACASTAGANTSSAAANQSPNLNLPIAGPTSKKELTALAALNRVGRNENVTSSPKTQGDVKQESPSSQHQSPQMPVAKPSGAHFTPPQVSPQMSPLHGPVIRHPQSPIGFVGMRVNSFVRLPPSPLARAAVPPHMQAPPPNMVNLPPGMVGMRHPHYNIPPPNLMPPNMPPEVNYNSMPPGGTPYGAIQAPPPGFQGYGQRPMNPGFFMGPAPAQPMLPPPPMAANPHAKGGKDNMLYHTQHHHHHHHHPPQPQPHPHQHPHLHPHHQQYHHNQHKPPPPLPSSMGSTNVAAPSPQVMIAPYNVKKTVN